MNLLQAINLIPTNFVNDLFAINNKCYNQFHLTKRESTNKLIINLINSEFNFEFDTNVGINCDTDNCYKFSFQDISGNNIELGFKR